MTRSSEFPFKVSDSTLNHSVDKKFLLSVEVHFWDFFPSCEVDEFNPEKLLVYLLGAE